VGVEGGLNPQSIRTLLDLLLSATCTDADSGVLDFDRSIKGFNGGLTPDS
jgi:hypothetical protein